MSISVRTLYYATVVLAGALAHTTIPEAIAGPGAADLLRRNSEAYAMALLIPLFWDLHAPGLEPASPRERLGGANCGRAAGWFALTLLAMVALQSTVLPTLGLGLPQAVVTLGEAFTATLVVSGYLTWSRSIVSCHATSIDGGATVSVAGRLAYYGIVVLTAVMVEQAQAVTVLGETVTGWIRLQSEAFTAMLLVPLYFDAVAARRSPRVRVVWYFALVAIPLLIQGGPLTGIMPESLRFWIGTTTEAFIATMLISAYFDVRAHRP